MSWIHTLNIGGQEVTLLRFPQNWASSAKVDIVAEAQIDESETGEEDRRPTDSGGRLYVHLSFEAEGEAAQEAREFFASYDRGLVAVPIWADMRTAAAYLATRYFKPAYVMNFDSENLDTQAIYSGTLPGSMPYASCVSLHFGRLAKVDPVRWEDDKRERGGFRIVIDADAPDSYRVGAVDEVFVASWPSELNYAESVTESFKIGVTGVGYGQGPRAATDNQEKAFRYGRRFDLALVKGQVRDFVSHFMGAHGPVEAFSAPSFFAPGVATPETPHGTVVRFSEERVRLDFTDTELARSSVGFVQVPWEINPDRVYVQGRRVFLYKICYKLPEPQFTYWVAAAESVFVDGQTYVHGFVEEARIKRSLRDFAAMTQRVSSHAGPENPFMVHVLGEAEAPIEVDVYTVDPNNLTTSLKHKYKGEVVFAKAKGRQVETTLKVAGGVLEHNIGEYGYSVSCKAPLFSEACGVSKAAFKANGAIVSQGGNVLRVSSGSAPGSGYFGRGTIEVGSGANWQKRSIEDSVKEGGGVQALTLDRPFRSVSDGQAVVFYPGCDYSRSMCHEKFNNADKQPAHPHMPEENITLKSFDQDYGGGKK